MIITLNEENFKKEVLEEAKPVVVDFYAIWCPPCQALHPIFETLAEKHGDKIKFGRLDVGQNEKIAQDYSIMSVPTLVFFKDGKEVKRIIGLVGQDELEKNLEIF